MKDPRYLPDSALEYIVEDLSAAIAAFPRSFNTEGYLNQLRYCETVLEEREHIRTLRRQLVYGIGDWLGKPISAVRSRRLMRTAHGTQSNANSAGWRLAVLKRYGC